MVSAVAHDAGLNPKAFRLSKSWQSLTQNRVRAVVDLGVLRQFVHLDRLSQKKLAAAANLSPEQVYDFLIDAELRTTIF